MGAWAEGLAEQSRRSAAHRKAIKDHEDAFKEHFLVDIENKKYEIGDLSLIALRQVLKNTESLCLDNEIKVKAASRTLKIINRLEEYFKNADDGRKVRKDRCYNNHYQDRINPSLELINDIREKGMPECDLTLPQLYLMSLREILMQQYFNLMGKKSGCNAWATRWIEVHMLTNPKATEVKIEELDK
jgi:hypothetical protein